MHHTLLENIISNNRDILTTFIDINKYPSFGASDIYSRLANLCDSVMIENAIDRKNNTEWINNISSLENLTVTRPHNLCLRNAHFLKTLCLSVESLDASLFDTLPETLRSISLHVKSYDIPSIKLPLSLRKLAVSARKVPEILNVKKLANLTGVIINFVQEPAYS
ncbi:unnamed protein product [Ambrosiozyma monospora]|uniref:Unnamed protein product n=1 Tax=Ambrosiozyma monospora TaxID=43982 RepID=A0ACB5TN30_AMBMO|nr:unnamed protein product [Ambrosiozyma monospora]